MVSSEAGARCAGGGEGEGGSPPEGRRLQKVCSNTLLLDPLGTGPRISGNLTVTHRPRVAARQPGSGLSQQEPPGEPASLPYTELARSVQNLAGVPYFASTG